MSEAAFMVSDEVALKLKRVFTWEEKVEICERWRCSGLSKTKFCKKNQLILSTFCGWCNRLWPKVQSHQLCQVAVLSSTKKQEMISPITIEFNLPNQIAAKVSLHEHQVLNLIKGLVYATSTPR